MTEVISTAYSAVTFLNAIATGYGAAAGINIANTVIVEPSNGLSINVFPTENDDTLITTCIDQVEKKYSLEIDDIKIETHAQLPPERGLKTSSAISTATVDALLQYYEVEKDHRQIIELAALASKEAGVSITGAIDDAYACFLGGLYLTNNNQMKVIQSLPLPKLVPLLLIPNEKLPKKEIKNLDQINSDLLEKARQDLINGNILNSIKLNTQAYAKHLLSDDGIITELDNNLNGTVGLNGAGPSLFILCERKERENNIIIMQEQFSKYSVRPAEFLESKISVI